MKDWKYRGILLLIVIVSYNISSSITFHSVFTDLNLRNCSNQQSISNVSVKLLCHCMFFQIISHFILNHYCNT